MKRVFLVFPGQGSQFVGMGKDVYESFEYVREMYDKASQVIDVDVKKISFEGPEDILKDTSNAQPCIFVHSAAILEVLKRESGNFEVIGVAGHSLGEYNALYSAGVFNFHDGVKIVSERGRLMANADPEGKGGMAAVIGLEPEKIKEICEAITKEGNYVEPVNYNSNDQVVISGYKEAIKIAEVKLKEAGAKRVIPLAVSGAFHSKLMESAAKEFRKFLDGFSFNKPSFRVFANYNANEYPNDEKEIKDLLEKQLVSPVLWVDIVKKIEELSPDLVIEVGPGQVLKGLIKKTSATLNVVTTSTFDGIKEVLNALNS